jgi:NADPH-dependent glutamate synthase beta subunit-like oxidoreductase
MEYLSLIWYFIEAFWVDNEVIERRIAFLKERENESFKAILIKFYQYILNEYR